MPEKYIWRTATVNKETDETITVSFDTGGRHFQYKAGQFINLTLSIDNQQETRSYSLSSSPGWDKNPAITVKRIPGGIASNYIFHHAHKVNQWLVEGPSGFFYPSAEASKTSQIVLIAAGSGITPVFSQLKFFLYQTADTILLVYANRTEADIIFKDELAMLEQLFQERLTIWSVLSRQDNVKDAQFKNSIGARLSKLILKKILKSQPGFAAQDTRFFICGPSTYIQLVEETLHGMNIEASNISKEYFAPADSDEPSFVLPENTMEVMFHFYEQSSLLEVRPGKTILEAALEDRIPVSYSCKNGTCGNCIARLLSGRLHMAKNFALNDALLKRGYVLLCQSYPLDNEVAIEAGIQTENNITGQNYSVTTTPETQSNFTS